MIQKKAFKHPFPHAFATVGKTLVFPFTALIFIPERLQFFSGNDCGNDCVNKSFKIICQK